MLMNKEETIQHIFKHNEEKSQSSRANAIIEQISQWTKISK